MHTFTVVSLAIIFGGRMRGHICGSASPRLAVAEVVNAPDLQRRGRTVSLGKPALVVRRARARRLILRHNGHSRVCAVARQQPLDGRRVISPPENKAIGQNMPIITSKGRLFVCLRVSRETLPLVRSVRHLSQHHTGYWHVAPVPQNRPHQDLPLESQASCQKTSL